MSTPLKWGEPEWFDPKDGVYDEAYAASDLGFLTECDVIRWIGEEGWFWMVNATSRLSESPEVQDAGPCATKEEGMAACQRVVDAVLARRAST